jgi:hypothetical protein
MKHVVIEGPVDHDGIRYEQGDELVIQPDAAASLIFLGVIKEVLPAKSKRELSD